DQNQPSASSSVWDSPINTSPMLLWIGWTGGMSNKSDVGVALMAPKRSVKPGGDDAENDGERPGAGRVNDQLRISPNMRARMVPLVVMLPETVFPFWRDG